MKRLVLVGIILSGCGSSDTSLPIEAQCNPLGVNHCMTPWPSSAFEVDDSTTATGRHLAIPAGTLPTNSDNIAADPSGWNTADGFSPAAPMVMSFPGGVSVTGLPPSDNFDLSLNADSPTVVYDLTANARVAHFAEVDAQAESADSQALLIRPAQRLIGGHHYAVAITKRVKAKDGSDLVVPPGFAALVDGTKTDHALLESMRTRMTEVLATLDTAGFPASDLVVAWDFTVASDAFVHRDMLTARERALTGLASHPIQFTITSDTPVGDGSTIKRRITGTLDAPLFLNNDGAAVNHTRLLRDADGLPALQGFYQIPFSAIVPTCAYGAAAKVGMVMYGHGLMGDSEETTGGVQQATANELCMVFAGTDMRGMSTPDLTAVAHALNDMSRADEVMDVLVQGMVNHITLAHALETTFATGLFTDGTSSLVDPTKVYYYGLSQGAIFGTAVMAYEPTIKRGVLGVGAGNYSMLLDRSADWPMYRTILQSGYPDALDDTLAVSMFQMRWDKVEGSGVANSVLAGTDTMTPPKQILLQVALGDEQVPNIGSYWLARSMQLPILGPSPAAPWGLSIKAGPFTSGSGLQIMDGGAPPNPVTNIPAPEQDPSMHDLTRIQPATRREMKQFFATGTIENECTGPCVCQDNDCN